MGHLPSSVFWGQSAILIGPSQKKKKKKGKKKKKEINIFFFPPMLVPLPQSTPCLFNSGNAQLGLNWDMLLDWISIFIFIRAEAVCCHAKSSAPVRRDDDKFCFNSSFSLHVMTTNFAPIVAFQYV
jgi:hypothetical protein